MDWAAQDGRLLLPVLGGPLAGCLDDLSLGEQATGGGAEPVLRYFEHVFPVRPGTAGLPLADLLAAQHYRLADWRLAATELNWRRFFDISSLIAVRVEDPEVFEATHAVILGLVAEGLIDGLRVDHPDGLADPRGYLRLAGRADRRAAGCAPRRSCPATSGCPPTGRAPAPPATTVSARSAACSSTRPGRSRWPPATCEFTGGAGGSSPGWPRRPSGPRPSRRWPPRWPGWPGWPARPGTRPWPAARPADLAAVLTELLTAMPVYRAYVLPGEPAPPESAAIMDQAAAAARRHLPVQLHPLLAAVTDLALTGPAPFATLFQQVCGPVMAKGVEDTAFYRWSRLTALNEVGGDPDRFGWRPAEFHTFAAHLARHWPGTLTTLSTHDTKRQEDVRARLAVLAEIPPDWLAEVTRWHDRAAALASGLVPDPDTEYLMWQTLVGAWPLDRERLTGYLVKAMREAKTRTSWTDPDAGYEAMVLSFAEQVLDDDELTSQLAGFVAALGQDARANSLGRSWSSSPCPGCPTCTRAASWPAWPWSTRTTGSRPTSPGTAGDWLRSAPRPPQPAGPARGRPGRGEAAGHLDRAAAAPRPPGLVRGRLPAAGRRGPGGRARGRVRPRRRRSPWSPGCRPACAAAAAGRAPCCRCPPAPTGTCSPVPRRPACARCWPRLPQRHPVALLIPAGSPWPDLDVAAPAADDAA